MGNCGNICTRNISKIKADIIINTLDKETDKYLEPNNIKKIIFLQKFIKKYLKKIKTKKKIFY